MYLTANTVLGGSTADQEWVGQVWIIYHKGSVEMELALNRKDCCWGVATCIQNSAGWTKVKGQTDVEYVLIWSLYRSMCWLLNFSRECARVYVRWWRTCVVTRCLRSCTVNSELSVRIMSAHVSVSSFHILYTQCSATAAADYPPHLIGRNTHSASTQAYYSLFRLLPTQCWPNPSCCYWLLPFLLDSGYTAVSWVAWLLDVNYSMM